MPKFILLGLLISVHAAPGDSDVFIRPAAIIAIPANTTGIYSPVQTHACKVTLKSTPAGAFREWSPTMALRLNKRVRPEVVDGKNHTALSFQSCTNIGKFFKRQMGCLDMVIECEYPPGQKIPADHCLVASNFNRQYVINQLGVNDATAAKDCPPAPLATGSPLASPTPLEDNPVLVKPTRPSTFTNPTPLEDDDSLFAPPTNQ